jgi:Ulp1 family protease
MNELIDTSNDEDADNSTQTIDYEFPPNTDFVEYFGITDTEYDNTNHINILYSFFNKFGKKNSSLYFKLQCFELKRLQPEAWLEIWLILTFFEFLNKKQQMLNVNQTLEKCFFTKDIFHYIDQPIENCNKLLKLFKNVNIFKYKFVLFVCHHKSHFTLVVVDFILNEIKYYDSLYYASFDLKKKNLQSKQQNLLPI